jgi:hypothetical protein
MDKPPQSRAPLIFAIVLLLLPVLYVGSYFALVDPPENRRTMRKGRIPASRLFDPNYRIAARYAEVVFYPLERIDRKVRPAAWD